MIPCHVSLEGIAEKKKWGTEAGTLACFPINVQTAWIEQSFGI